MTAKELPAGRPRPLAKAGAFALAAALTCSLSFPSVALAAVRIDQTELSSGENAIGGGTATLADAVLDLSDVVAEDFFTDENLTVNFNGGNEIDAVGIGGSAEVTLNFAGENEVEDIVATENADVTINANGCNEFEDVEAFADASITINVTGENDFESIEGTDNASITVKGTTCQKRDTVNLGDDEDDSCLATLDGDLVIDHATVNLQSESAIVGSVGGNVRIDTAKIAQDDGNEYAYITAGDTLEVSESVIEITGTIHSVGEMTVEHSDIDATKPDQKFHDDSPYRVFSETGIELVREENGKVAKGMSGAPEGEEVFFVDTGDGDDVKLKAAGEPAYYRCADDRQSEALPKTGDAGDPSWLAIAAFGSIAAAAFALSRRREDS